MFTAAEYSFEIIQPYKRSDAKRAETALNEPDVKVTHEFYTSKTCRKNNDNCNKPPTCRHVKETFEKKL